MHDQMRAIEADFRALAETLGALITLHDDDPTMVTEVGRLRRAQNSATRGAELVRAQFEREA